MKVIYDSKCFPSHDTMNYIIDWSKFESDARTQNLDLYFGVNFDVSQLNNDKVNVYHCVEHPGAWIIGRSPGMHAAAQKDHEENFDYLLTNSKITEKFHSEYQYAPYHGFDYQTIYEKFGIDKIDDVEKDIDVYMCTTANPNRTNDFAENPGERYPAMGWYEVMKKFNHRFCNSAVRELFKSWDEKTLLNFRSKISIVFAVNQGSTAAGRRYAANHYPWLKFDSGPGHKPCYPQIKARIFDAVMSKSIMLCYKDPFVDMEDPYKSPIEHYFTRDEDFIYFEDSIDLENKIKEILDDYENPKYKKMVDNAHDKIMKNFNIDAWYEKYIVPLAKKGKAK